jgi:hypothetical protein
LSFTHFVFGIWLGAVDVDVTGEDAADDDFSGTGATSVGIGSGIASNNTNNSNITAHDSGDAAARERDDKTVEREKDEREREKLRQKREKGVDDELPPLTPTNPTGPGRYIHKSFSQTARRSLTDVVV